MLVMINYSYLLLFMFCGIFKSKLERRPFALLSAALGAAALSLKGG